MRTWATLSREGDGTCGEWQPHQSKAAAYHWVNHLPHSVQATVFVDEGDGRGWQQAARQPAPISTTTEGT